MQPSDRRLHQSPRRPPLAPLAVQRPRPTGDAAALAGALRPGPQMAAAAAEPEHADSAAAHERPTCAPLGPAPPSISISPRQHRQHPPCPRVRHDIGQPRIGRIEIARLAEQAQMRRRRDRAPNVRGACRWHGRSRRSSSASPRRAGGPAPKSSHRGSTDAAPATAADHGTQYSRRRVEPPLLSMTGGSSKRRCRAEYSRARP